MTAGTRSSKFLTESDYQSAAGQLNCSLAAIKAVAEVESRGDGFLPSGHPKVLFERHVMYQRVRTKFGAAKADSYAAKHPDIINKTAGGYGTESAQPGRMDRAAKLIDRDCALESASWGKFQIMGYHWRSLGFASLQSFINSMYANEAGHLFAFQRFILVDPSLHKALQDRDWATFARLYNGPAFQANNYHIKLSDAYAKHAKQYAASA